MDTALKYLVAHVLVTRPGPSYAGATGFLIGKERILTVAHVFKDWTEKCKLEVRFCDIEPRQWVPARCCWPAAFPSEIDAAIVAFADDDLTRRLHEKCGLAPWQLVSRRTWSSQTKWESYGLPKAGYRTVGRVKHAATPYDFFGKAGTLDPDQHCSLSVEASALDAEGWQGASGSPVFIDGCLAGMVVEALEAAPAALRCLAASAIVGAEGFKEAVGWSDSDDDLAVAQESITKALASSPLAIEALRTIEPRFARVPSRLANQALEWGLDELLSLCAQASVSILDRDDGDALRREGAIVALERVIEIILPLVYDQALVIRLRQQEAPGDVALLSIPVSTAAVAEIVVAGLDGRDVAYRTRRERLADLLGTFSLPKRPTSGWTLGVEAVREDLAWVLLDDDLREAAAAAGDAELERAIREVLHELAGRRKGRLRYYALVREGSAQSADAVLAQRLRALFPDLRLLMLRGGDLSREAKTIRNLKDIIPPTNDDPVRR
ncbi:MAG: trypsin-like peptidase domain-containing protein [Polyangiaceae bacterium]|nr:trypsin-like peptidase domain-containing protein [Polyangiaceae bacterium]